MDMKTIETEITQQRETNTFPNVFCSVWVADRPNLNILSTKVLIPFYPFFLVRIHIIAFALLQVSRWLLGAKMGVSLASSFSIRTLVDMSGCTSRP